MLVAIPTVDFNLTFHKHKAGMILDAATYFIFLDSIGIDDDVGSPEVSDDLAATVTVRQDGRIAAVLRLLEIPVEFNHCFLSIL